MELLRVEDYDALSRAAANRVGRLIASRPGAVLGLPTGETPLGMYRELVGRVREGRLDVSAAIAFSLDEFHGLPPEHPASFCSFLRRHFFEPAGIPPSRTRCLCGDAPDPEAECAVHEAAIAAAGGIDLQVLGIGRNGHIGYNEPGTPFSSRAHVAPLAPETREAAAAAFGAFELVPLRGVTLGIQSILAARQVMLLASGAEKAGAVKAALRGPVTPEVPASALQGHPALTVVVDAAAAALL